MFKKILVALDGSEHADHALNYALDLAKKYSASLELLTVLHCEYISFDIDSMDFIEPQALGEYLDAQKAYCEKVLSQALEKVKKSEPCLKVSTKVKEGRPADEIVEAAKEGRFDLIVMGGRGIGGIKKFLLGSVSDRVADHAECPVLIVK